MASPITKLKTLAKKAVSKVVDTQEAIKQAATNVAKNVSAISAANKPMVFRVGENLSTEQKKRADEVVARQVESQKKEQAFVKNERGPAIPANASSIPSTKKPIASKSMTFNVGEGLSAEQKKRADSVVRRQVDLGTEEQAFKDKQPFTLKKVVKESIADSPNRSALFAQGVKQLVPNYEGPRYKEADQVAMEESMNFAGTTEGISSITRKSIAKKPLLAAAKETAESLKKIDVPASTVDDVVPANFGQKDIPVTTPPITPAAPEVPVPAAAGKERGFITTVKNAELSAPEVKSKVQGTYEPITNKKTLSEAQAMIDQNPDKALEMVLNKGEKPSAVKFAAGQDLMRRAQEAGDFQRAVDIAESVAEQATTAGQAVQALSMWSRLTPEGALAYTQRLINRANTERGMKYALDPKAAEGITKIARELQDGLAKGIPKEETDALTRKLLNEMTDQVPPSTWQKVAALRRISLLLNPKTFTRNVLGNTIFAGAENLSDILGTAIDLPLSVITGKRTKAIPSLGVQLKGLKKGISAGIKEVKEGGADKLAEGTTAKRVFKGPVLGRLEKALGYSLQVPDKAAYTAAFDSKLDQLMRIAKTEEPTAEMLEAAHASALYRTFQDETTFGQIFTGIKNSLNKIGNKEFGLGDALLAFTKTPGSIAQKTFVDYSPVGFVKAAYELAAPLIGGKLSAKTFNQEAFVNALSRAGLGSATIGLGAYLAKVGIISGRREKDKGINALKAQEGKGAYKMNVSALKRWVLSGFDDKQTKERVGDVMYSYDWAQPVSTVLSVGANIKAGETPDLESAFFSSTQTLTDQPLLTGLKKFFDQLAFGAELGEAFASSVKDLPSSFVPTLLNQIRQIVDNNSRETYDPSKLKESFNLMQNRIPFLAEKGIPGTPLKGLPKKSELVGGSKENYQDGSNSFFNVFINPGFVSTLKETPEVKELLDLYERTGEKKQNPDPIGKSETVNGVKFQLSAADYSEANKYIGERSKSEIQRIIENPAYKRLTDAQKVNTLSKYLGQVNKEAKAPAYFKAIGVDVPKWLPQTMQAKLIQAATKSPTFKMATTPERQKEIWDTYFVKLEQVIKNRDNQEQPVEGKDLPEVSMQGGGRPIGTLSARFESQGDPGAIGYDRTGGWSYGKYQLAHNNALKFVQNSPFAKYFQGLKFNSESWKGRWKEIARRVPDAFARAQHNFIEKTHVEPQLTKLAKAGFDVAKASSVLKDVIWSTAVQHGPGNDIILTALNRLGKNPSERDLIKQIYAIRWSGGKRFAKSTPQVKKAVYNRFFGKDGELATALKELGTT